MQRTILAVLAVGLLGASKPEAPKPANDLLFAIGTPNGEEHAVKAKELIERYLTQALATPVRVRIIPDAADLALALPKGEVDAGWLPPIAFARASTQSSAVKALVKAKRNGRASYRTAYIVRHDSPAKILPELAGKKIAWVSPSSASGYLFARSLLSWAGRDPDRFFGSEIFAGTHPDVCKAVRSGAVDVGATLADPPRSGQPFVADGCADAPPMSDFRVIAASEPIPNDVIAVGPRLAPQMATALAGAFRKMGESPEGQALMKDAFRSEAWLEVGDKDFETVFRVLGTPATVAPAAELPAPAAAPAAPAAKKAPKTKAR